MYLLFWFNNTEADFALKGGTALNFLVRDMPRLSVDIDLTYIPVNNRKTALADIRWSLLFLAEKIGKMFPESQTTLKKIPPYALLRDYPGADCPAIQHSIEDSSRPFSEIGNVAKSAKSLLIHRLCR